MKLEGWQGEEHEVEGGNDGRVWSKHIVKMYEFLKTQMLKLYFDEENPSILRSHKSTLQL